MDVLRRNAVTISGTGPSTLVLVHGLGCDQTIWSALAPRLATDHRVVLFDLVGAGRSDRSAYDPERHASLMGFAEDLLDVVRAVAGPAPVVIGHSLGASLAVHAATLDPTFASALVLLVASPRFLDDPPDYRGGFRPEDLDEVLATMDRNYPAWAASFASTVAPQPAVAETMTLALSGSDPSFTHRLTELVLRSDLRPLLPRVTIPALSVQCADDPLIPLEAGALVAQLLPHGRGELLDLPGHCPHLSHPELVEAAIRRYLQRDACS